MAENPESDVGLGLVGAETKPKIAAAESGAIQVKEETRDLSGVPPIPQSQKKTIEKISETLPSMPPPKSEFKTSVQMAGSLYTARPTPKTKPLAKESDKGSKPELTPVETTEKQDIPSTSAGKSGTKPKSKKEAHRAAANDQPKAGTSTLKDDNEDDQEADDEPAPMPFVRPAILVTKGSTEAPVVVLQGDTETPTESSTRLARIQEQLYTDSCGNILPQMPMSNIGRYKARRSVDGQGLFRLDDTAKKQAAILKRRNEALREEVEKRLGDKLDEELSMGTLQKVISDLDKADSAKASPQSPEPVPEKSVEDDRQSKMKVLPSVTIDPKDVDVKKKPPPPPPGKPMSMATIISIKRMRDRIGGRVVTAKTFAKDRAHEEKLKEHTHNIAIGIPIPLKITIHEEAMQIVMGTVKAYTKTLGKKHALTVEAEQFLADMKKKADDYAQI